MRADRSCRIESTGELKQIAIDPEKAGPSDLRRRHRREVHGEPARTDLWGTRSAAEHKNGRRVASRVRPPLLSRTASTRRPEAEGPWREQHVLHREMIS